MKTLKYFGMVFALALVIGCAVTFFTYSNPSVAKPVATWSSPSVEQTLRVGELALATTTFTVSKDMQDVTAWVTPALAPYVTVWPASFASLVKGQTYELNVAFRIPDEAPIDTFDGTVQLRQGTTTVAKPLPVSLEIDYPFDIDLVVPANWYIESRYDTLVLRNVIAPSLLSEETLQTESFFKIERLLEINKGLLPIEQWFNEKFSYRLSSEILDEYPLVINGHDAYHVEISGIPGRRAMVYIDDGANVLLISYGLHTPYFIDDYEAILNSVRF